MSNRLDWIESRLGDLKKSNQLRKLQIRESPHVQGKVQLEGTACLDFASNDYLGLAADSRLVDAVKQSTGYVGWGSGASPLIHGRGTLHARLEQELAEFENTEAALLFSSGFAANVGVIQAVAGENDLILSDANNHASIVDGCRLSRADVQVYRHNDLDYLKSILENSGGYRRRLLVTDGLFSMHGDFAPLSGIAELCEQYDTMLMVDEAHGTGVFGKQGRGISEELGVSDAVDIKIGTLSKALGSAGGFVCGSRPLIDWLINQARTYIYSTAPPDATCMAAVSALQHVRENPLQRSELVEKSNAFRSALNSLGFDCGPSTSQIIPVILKSNDAAVRASQLLKEAGFYVPAIRPPSVPDQQALLRISLTTAHRPEDLSGLMESIQEIISTARQ